MTKNQEEPITPQVAAERARKIIKEHGDDPEIAHHELDDLLCKVLSSLGYAELVDAFYDQTKWYA